MMLRSIMIIPVLALGLSMAVAAQQISEQDARKAIERRVEEWNKSFREKNVAELLGHYMEDAIRVSPEGVIFGRAAIEKRLAEDVKVFTPTGGSKLEQVKVIGNGIILATGS